MPIKRFTCDFNDEGSTTYMKFPASCLPEFAKAFYDGCGHQGKVLLVLNRERQMLEIVTRRSFDLLCKEIEARANAETASSSTD